jgi:hypothetical protein
MENAPGDGLDSCEVLRGLTNSEHIICLAMWLSWTEGDREGKK